MTLKFLSDFAVSCNLSNLRNLEITPILSFLSLNLDQISANQLEGIFEISFDMTQKFPVYVFYLSRASNLNSVAELVIFQF